MDVIDLVPSATGAALRAGDRVLLTFIKQPTTEEAGSLQAQLAERFPGVQFTVVVGAQMTVVAGGAQ